MIKEAILLVGGLGTRLHSEVDNLPKSMAPINDKPFLAYQMAYLKSYGISKVILATGYLSESISDYFGHEYMSIKIEYSIEETPLGTGGAIKQALEKVSEESVLILNGDTLFKVDLAAFYQNHLQSGADFSMALKPMKNFNRYGVVVLDHEQQVIGFEEKKEQLEGNINGGIYLLNKTIFKTDNYPPKFSFEKMFLEEGYKDFKFIGFTSATYFLDIGIPSDYHQAQIDFKKEFGNF